MPEVVPLWKDFGALGKAYLSGMTKALLLLCALTVTASAARLDIQAGTTGPHFIAQPAVKARLGQLLGPARLTRLQKDFQTVSTVQNSPKVAAFSGCQAHDCGANDAVVIYDRANDALQVVMHVQGQKFTYTEKKSFSSKFFNTDLNTLLSN